MVVACGYRPGRACWRYLRVIYLRRKHSVTRRSSARSACSVPVVQTITDGNRPILPSPFCRARKRRVRCAKRLPGDILTVVGRSAQPRSFPPASSTRCRWRGQVRSSRLRRATAASTVGDRRRLDVLVGCSFTERSANVAASRRKGLPGGVPGKPTMPPVERLYCLPNLRQRNRPSRKVQCRRWFTAWGQALPGGRCPHADLQAGLWTVVCWLRSSWAARHQALAF